MDFAPNLIDTKDTEQRQEGVIDVSSDVLDIGLEDDEIVRIIGSRIGDAEAWWNKELKLDEARKESYRYYIGDSFDPADLYEHQVPYKDNVIFTSIETLIPLAVSQAAEPIVTEGNDSDESRQLAMDLNSVLKARYEDTYLKDKVSKITRHILTGKRVGILKYRFDDGVGKQLSNGTLKGQIVWDVVQPEKVVFEQRANDPEDISLIAEYLEATIEELVQKFPVKKADIFRAQGISRGTPKQLNTSVGYIEVWFTYYKDGKKDKRKLSNLY